MKWVPGQIIFIDNISISWCRHITMSSHSDMRELPAFLKWNKSLKDQVHYASSKFTGNHLVRYGDPLYMILILAGLFPTRHLFKCPQTKSRFDTFVGMKWIIRNREYQIFSSECTLDDRSIIFFICTRNGRHISRPKMRDMIRLRPLSYSYGHWDRVTHTCVSKLIIVGLEMACRLVGAKPLPEPML